MSRLYLRCVICSRQQAEGLISGAAWGRLELPGDAVVHHPGVSGSLARVCPSCVSSHPDWQARVLSNLGLAPNSGFSLRVDSV
jgi:pyruvate dehydrogenase complex dehydrogenase (E1) component